MQHYPAMGPGDDEPTLASIQPHAPGGENMSLYSGRPSPGWSDSPPSGNNQAFAGRNNPGVTPYNDGRQFSSNNGNGKNNRPLIIALVAILLVLVLLFSTGIYAFTHSGPTNPGQGNQGNQQRGSTATASVGNQPTADTTATANAQATTSASATAGAQGSVDATATASAQGIANATATAVAQESQFDGTWLNDDLSTRGIPGLIIGNSGQTITVHGYGRCHPTDCNWGARSGTFHSSPFVILFDFGNGLTDQLTISFNNGGNTQLKVVDTGSSSGTNTYFFHRNPAASGGAAQFNGTWLNDDASTNGIPRLVISSSGNTITVHGYGACSPTNCDWGTQSGTYTGSPFVLTFTFSGGSLTHQLTISFNDAGEIQLKVIDNGSASGMHTYYFNRG